MQLPDMKISSAENELESKVVYHVLFLIICIIGLSLISVKNFLLFHSVVEMFSIIIAFTIFIIAINTYKLSYIHKPLVLLGVAYAFVGGIDLLHVLAYKGMGVFPQYTANLPTQLWIIARYIESISLLLSILFLNKKLNIHIVFVFYLIVSSILLILLFQINVFPDCFIEGTGLTSFKIISEYIVSAIILIGMFMLIHQRKRYNSKGFYFFLLAFISTIVSEITFVHYEDVYSFQTVIGHLFKVFSYYCIYKSIITANVKLPYQELYRKGRDYYRFIQMLPEAIFIHKGEEFIYVNDAAVKLLGASSSQEIIGKSIWSVIHPKYKNCVENGLKQLKDNVDILFTNEQQIITMDRKNLF